MHLFPNYRKQLIVKRTQLKFGTRGHLVKHKWATFDPIAFNVIGGYLVHLFRIHDNVLTAVVIVIKLDHLGPWASCLLIVHGLL